jgi:hypothetical protein
MISGSILNVVLNFRFPFSLSPNTQYNGQDKAVTAKAGPCGM